MTTIKQLIQETEELLEAKKLTIEVLHKSEDNPVFVQTRNEIIKLGVKLETLKLCQEIQDEKVKELKDEMQQAKSGLPCKSAGYHTILELIYEIDKILGEETQAVKE